MTKQLAKSEVKTIAPIDDVRNSLTKMKEQFKAALPPQISVDKFTRVAMTAIQANPGLLTTDRRSLFGELMKCAQDGLLPDGREATIQVYKIKGVPAAKYMPMIGGILKKVRNSGELATITSQIVYENDKFRYWIDDDGEHVEHEPLLFGDRGAMFGVYALAKTKDNEVYIEPMNKDQVMAVKETSKAKDSGPWSGPFETEMWRKTAVRRLSKRLPMSTDLDEVIRRDDDLYDLNKPEESKSLEETKVKSSRLGKLLEPQSPAEKKSEEAITETEPQQAQDIADIEMPEWEDMGGSQ